MCPFGNDHDVPCWLTTSTLPSLFVTTPPALCVFIIHLSLSYASRHANAGGVSQFPCENSAFASGTERQSARPNVVAVELAPEHRIRHTLRLSLRRRARLGLHLTRRRRRNRAIHPAIGDALQRVCNSRQLERHLVRSVRPL